MFALASLTIPWRIHVAKFSYSSYVRGSLTQQQRNMEITRARDMDALEAKDQTVTTPP